MSSCDGNIYVARYRVYIEFSKGEHSIPATNHLNPCKLGENQDPLNSKPNISKITNTQLF